ncbi:hypothetical protein C8046_07720 [Serinibacter arcticus]|uniref:Uncharacterized protein n=1 Tax=Serinibacter arcticus TaxID=1655435 RepID=A0A2U1ZU97_9MICO|nr:hypothetical protein C8046_07720 [Serinibacter arcticus]
MFTSRPWPVVVGLALVGLSGLVLAPLVDSPGSRAMGLVLASLTLVRILVAIRAWRRDVALVPRLRARPVAPSSTRPTAWSGAVVALLGTVALVAGIAVPAVAVLVASPLLLAALAMLRPRPVHVAIEPDGVVIARRGDLREEWWTSVHLRPPARSGRRQGVRLSIVGDPAVVVLTPAMLDAVGDAVHQAWLLAAPQRLAGREILSFGAVRLSEDRLGRGERWLPLADLSKITAEGHRVRFSTRWAESIAVPASEIANAEVLDQLLIERTGLGLPSGSRPSAWGSPTTGPAR